jgi:hypothetical protein
MEKIRPSFEYEPLVISLEPMTSNEEKYRRDIDGVGPLGIQVAEEPRDLKGGKDNPKREVVEQILFYKKLVFKSMHLQPQK